MVSLFSGTSNTRVLIPGSMRYLRSDAPVCLSAEDIRFLKDSGIRTVVDLRSDTEHAAAPSPLETDPYFHYYRMIVTDGDIVPASLEDIVPSYIKMADKQMALIIALIEGSKDGVLYFCHAGKDRTGIVSAILLRRMGVDRETIVQDYLLSAECLHDAIESYARKTGIDRRILTPQRASIEAFLDWLDTADTPF